MRTFVIAAVAASLLGSAAEAQRFYARNKLAGLSSASSTQPSQPAVPKPEVSNQPGTVDPTPKPQVGNQPGDPQVMPPPTAENMPGSPD